MCSAAWSTIARCIGSYYPKARKMLRLSQMPDDIYNSCAFAHSRAWDEQVRAAGYTPRRIGGTWNWNIIRDELAGRSRPSATVGCSDLGNSNGAKFDLNQNYLRYAEATGHARIYPGHRVDTIAQGRSVGSLYRRSDQTRPDRRGAPHPDADLRQAVPRPRARSAPPSCWCARGQPARCRT